MISHPNTMAAAIARLRWQRLALHESLDALQQEADMCRLLSFKLLAQAKLLSKPTLIDVSHRSPQQQVQPLQ